MLQIEVGGFDITKPKKQFWNKDVWRCPAAHLKSINGTTYGYNIYGIAGTYTNNLGLEGHFVSMEILDESLAESEVVAPSEMMAIGDSDSMAFIRDERVVFRGMNLRHGNLANVVFCDGHVESPTLKFLFEDTSDAALVRWNRDHLPHRDKLKP